MGRAGTPQCSNGPGARRERGLSTAKAQAGAGRIEPSPGPSPAPGPQRRLHSHLSLNAFPHLTQPFPSVLLSLLSLQQLVFLVSISPLHPTLLTPGHGPAQFPGRARCGARARAGAPSGRSTSNPRQPATRLAQDQGTRQPRPGRAARQACVCSSLAPMALCSCGACVLFCRICWLTVRCVVPNCGMPRPASPPPLVFRSSQAPMAATTRPSCGATSSRCRPR